MLSQHQERKLQAIKGDIMMVADVSAENARELCKMIEMLKEDNRNLHRALKRCMEMQRTEARP